MVHPLLKTPVTDGERAFNTMKAKNRMDDLKINRIQPVVIQELTDGRPSENDTRVGETLILSREEGRLYQLNPTASFIWDCCDGNSNIADITERLAGAYEVDSSTARKDVEEVLSNLRNSNLLDGLEGTKGKF
jgi:Coenzyme PQQ synthesis protein D (PqqD)